MSRPRHTRAVVIVVLVAAIVRTLHVIAISRGPAFATPLVDARTYHTLAADIAAGHGIAANFFWQGTFYPAFLALIYAFAGPAIAIAKILQLGVGIATCVATYAVGRRLFDDRVAFIASMIVALYGPLLFFETELVATVWIVWFAIALLLVVLRLHEQPAPSRALVAGVVAGGAVLCWSAFLPFVAATAAWLTIAQVHARAVRLRVLAIALAGFAVATAPVVVLCDRATGEAHLLPSSGGLNLYLGNNPDPEQTLGARPSSEEWRAIRGMPGADSPGTYDRSRYYTAKTIEYIREWPVDFIAGLAHKTLLFVAGVEIPRNEDAYVYRRWSPVLWLTMWKVGGFGFPFGVLLPLAVVGAITAARRLRGPVALFLLLYPAAIILVFVSGRYRVPIVPLLAIFAAAGALHVVDAVRRRACRRLAIAMSIAVATGVLCALPVDPWTGRVDLEAEMYRLLGNDRISNMKYDDAIALYTRALAVAPNYPQAEHDLALAYQQLGRDDDARHHFEIEAQLRRHRAN